MVGLGHFEERVIEKRGKHIKSRNINCNLMVQTVDSIKSPISIMLSVSFRQTMRMICVTWTGFNFVIPSEAKAVKPSSANFRISLLNVLPKININSYQPPGFMFKL